MKNKYKYKNVLVYGLSMSGTWCAKLLTQLKANVYLYDDNQAKLKDLCLKKCYILQTLNENLISQFDFIVVSPSIEQNNQYIKLAKKFDINIYSEIEFASLFSKNLVAVTGTNGKTTTVQLITALLNTRHKAIACGNIGYPLSKAVINNKKYIHVAEVSSFMLENCNSFSPHVATITNISADHLIRHKTMQEYANLKTSIYKNLKSKDFAVINLDAKIDAPTNCKVVTYSYSRHADVRVKNGYIYLHQQKLIAINQLKLKGKHNIMNIMCAICYAYIYKVNTKKMVQVLANFEVEKFRIQHVAQIKGVNFVNDSKSTNISSTLASTETIKGPLILLLGGAKKGLDYTELFDNLTKRVRKVIAYGDIADDLQQANQDKFDLHIVKDLNTAFDAAVDFTKKSDTVLLSPASASYDQFENYIERGNFFNQKVKEYENSTKKK
ncbi:MAG: UDP-N-acetylmuramoyl-L-alanine--D-glutamate ligase [Clostridia bacterium]|nr:UDP-N-acetylmuramoyl-L-alanine--D-glutamate ligase [Clostridia bacterium]